VAPEKETVAGVGREVVTRILLNKWRAASDRLTLALWEGRLGGGKGGTLRFAQAKKDLSSDEVKKVCKSISGGKQPLARGRERGKRR